MESVFIKKWPAILLAYLAISLAVYAGVARWGVLTPSTDAPKLILLATLLAVLYPVWEIQRSPAAGRIVLP